MAEWLLEDFRDEQAVVTITETDTQIGSPVMSWIQKEHTPLKPTLLIVIGAPTMAEFLALSKRMTPKDRMLILEHDRQQARRCIAVNLLEGLIRDGKVLLAGGENKAEIKQRFFALLNPKLAPSIELIDTERASDKACAFYYELLTEAREEARLDVFNAGTLVCRGPLWQFNTLKNLPHIVNNPGIDSLRDAFRGKPALVIGAGPSLNDALPLIRKLANRFVLIATGTALRPLRKQGIRPDIVIAVDGSHLIRPQFETTCDDLYFACSSLVYSDITDRFRGIFSGGLEASPIDQWINKKMPTRGMLYAGGTVTCSAMYLASLMGCPQVCTVGLDLCFKSDGTTHASETMYHGRHLDPEKLVRAKGNYQESVPTTQQFKCYIDLVRDFVAKFPQTEFININNGGACISGMTVAPIEALTEYAAAPFNAYNTIQRIHRSFCPRDLEAIRLELEAAGESLKNIREKSVRAAQLCGTIVNHLQNPGSDTLERLRPCMQELDELETEIEQAKTDNIFIQMSLWPTLYEFGMTLDEQSAEKTLPEQQETFQRFRNLYEQIGGASRWTYDVLLQVLDTWNQTCRHPAPLPFIDQPTFHAALAAGV
jgi:hypothetical protein